MIQNSKGYGSGLFDPTESAFGARLGWQYLLRQTGFSARGGRGGVGGGSGGGGGVRRPTIER